MNAPNLDQLCARYGHQMAQELSAAIKKAAENHITKSLGVLQEDGVYAFFLYQESRKSEKAGADKLKALAAELLKQAGIKPFDSAIDSLEAVRGNPHKQIAGLVANLDDLLLAKCLLEQALIYARYHAKALGG